MYVISSFKYSINLELAISNLEKKGIKKENILAIPLDKRYQKQKYFDSIDSSDGVSLFDISAILATILGLFGVIYGYNLEWGPIIWGLIGLILGGLIGLIIDIIPKNKVRLSKGKNDNLSEVILMIYCTEGEVKTVKDILWENFALGVGIYNKINKTR